MEWPIYNNMEGHYCVMADFRFVHTITKLDLDRRMKARCGLTFDVEKFNICYSELERYLVNIITRNIVLFSSSSSH